MDSKSLMIGDWVNICGEPKQVKDLDIRRVGIVFSKLIHAVDETQVFPIPLTAEILEKNGFVGDKQVMQYHFTEDGQKYHFSLRQMYDKDDNPKGYSFFAFSVLTIIDYVHQLQHALRLCGIGKEIVL